MSAPINAQTLAKTQLRFLTCGSVDDGKSTLIGRLLFEAGAIPEDQLATLERDSRRHGTTGEDVDFALLVDGLEAERQQGVTIDVAYRYFATQRRSFIVADTPGHEQYTRNMATGASTAELAILLVDARKGLSVQTKRHAFIVSLLGVRQVVLAINKIDLVGFDQGVSDQITADFHAFAELLGFEQVQAIPLSARHGDNLTSRSERTPWYAGPTLLEHLETVEVTADPAGAPFRFPVQWVNRPDLDFRGFSGTVAAGAVKVGDAVAVAASGRQSTVARIVTYDGDLAQANVGDAVTLTLADEIDVARGDLLAHARSRPEVTDQFAARLIWMSEEPLLPGRAYLMKIGTRYVPIQVTALTHKIDVETLGTLPAKTLALNEIGLANLSAATPVPIDPYDQHRATGGFILIDRYTNATAGAGMIVHGLRRAANIHWQAVLIDRAARERLAGHRACALWFTGLSGSGKSTIANLVERKLHARGVRTFLLDGDNVRHGLNRDLGFTDADRVENIRRVAEVSRLFVDAGVVTLSAFISPFHAERAMARELFGKGEFIEVFVDTPLEVCQARDPKGLYAKAGRGELKNFTGLDSPYEVPADAEIVVRTVTQSAEDAADAVVTELERRGVI